jgi:hypothetical protein
MTIGLPQMFGTGLGLSAAAGLNSYAVLLVYGGMARMFPEDYPGSIARLLSTTGPSSAPSSRSRLSSSKDRPRWTSWRAAREARSPSSRTS